MINILLIEEILFSKKFTSKELAERWGISESTIKSYRQTKGTSGWRNWKAISIEKAEEIMKIENKLVSDGYSIHDKNRSETHDNDTL